MFAADALNVVFPLFLIALAVGGTIYSVNQQSNLAELRDELRSLDRLRGQPTYSTSVRCGARLLRPVQHTSSFPFCSMSLGPESLKIWIPFVGGIVLDRGATSVRVESSSRLRVTAYDREIDVYVPDLDRVLPILRGAGWQIIPG